MSREAGARKSCQLSSAQKVARKDKATKVNKQPGSK